MFSLTLDADQYEDHFMSCVNIDTVPLELSLPSVVRSDQTGVGANERWEPTTVSDWSEARELNRSS